MRVRRGRGMLLDRFARKTNAIKSATVKKRVSAREEFLIDERDQCTSRVSFHGQASSGGGGGSRYEIYEASLADERCTREGVPAEERERVRIETADARRRRLSASQFGFSVIPKNDARNSLALAKEIE